MKETCSIERLTLGDFQTNCWIYPFEGDALERRRPCAVIDPGGDAPVIISYLERLGLYPVYILLTHGHFDHLGALPDLAMACAAPEKPVIAIHREDASYLGADAWETHRKSFRALGVESYLKRLFKPMPAPDRLLAEGEDIGPFNVIHLPGHTPGSVAFLDREGRLFAGDTLFRGACGRTDLPGGSEEEMRKSLSRLFTLPPETEVFPGHGPCTSISGERDR